MSIGPSDMEVTGDLNKTGFFLLLGSVLDEGA